MILTTDGEIARLIGRIRRVAMIGASPNPNRAAFFVFSYLKSQGLDMVPVNPAYPAVAGVPTAPSIGEVDPRPDVADIFRNPADLPEVVADVVAAGVPALWLQYGVVHEGAIAAADAAGLDVVVNRCLKVEWARLHGGLAAAGMNTRRLSSRRAS